MTARRVVFKFHIEDQNTISQSVQYGILFFFRLSQDKSVLLWSSTRHVVGLRLGTIAYFLKPRNHVGSHTVRGGRELRPQEQSRDEGYLSCLLSVGQMFTNGLMDRSADSM